MKPEDNIKIVQKAYADFLRGDIPAVVAAMDDHIEWLTPASVGMPRAGRLNGKKQAAEFFGAVAETWEFQAFEPREYIASGDQVVVRGHYECRGRKTGGTASADWVMTWKIRDGKVTHFQEYTDTAVLREALSNRAGV